MCCQAGTSGVGRASTEVPSGPAPAVECDLFTQGPALPRLPVSSDEQQRSFCGNTKTQSIGSHEGTLTDYLPLKAYFQMAKVLFGFFMAVQFLSTYQ